MKRVAVIGAGAAGLCCARHLSRFPETFQFTVYEQSEQVGGVWVYDNPTPGKIPKDVRDIVKLCEPNRIPFHSTMYKHLRTNLPKEIMLFPGFPFNDHLPSFVHHTDVRSYLEKYTEHYKLDRFIQPGKLVDCVSPLPQTSADQIDSVRWSVSTQGLSTGQRASEEFDFVLICNGHYFAPHVPQLRGLSSFPHPVIHSSWYKEPESFKNQSVLVVGAGPSGMDLVIDLAAHARVVYLCSRVTPKSKVPENVEKLPGISELKEDGRVCFENGEERSVDCVVLATGYLYSYPFLSEESGIKVVEGKRVTHLYKHTFNVAHPSMAVVGVNSGLIPFPTFDLQVQWIVRVWRGMNALPPKQEMIRDVDAVYESRLQDGLPPHRAGHYLGDKRWEFNEQLSQLGGIEPPPPVVRPLYDLVREQRACDVATYRDNTFTIINNKEFSYS